MTDTALCNKGHLVTYKTECIDDGPPKFCDKLETGERGPRTMLHMRVGNGV